MPQKDPAARRAYDETRREQRRVAQRQYRRRIRELIDTAKRRPCADCGGTYPPCVMDFDHRDPGEKRIGIGSGTHSLTRVREEIAKCDVVCANCHRLRTHACPA